MRSCLSGCLNGCAVTSVDNRVLPKKCDRPRPAKIGQGRPIHPKTSWTAVYKCVPCPVTLFHTIRLIGSPKGKREELCCIFVQTILIPALAVDHFEPLPNEAISHIWQQLPPSATPALTYTHPNITTRIPTQFPSTLALHSLPVTSALPRWEGSSHYPYNFRRKDLRGQRSTPEQGFGGVTALYPPCRPSPRYAEDDDYLAHANLLSPSAPFSLHRNEPRPAQKTQPPPTTAGDAHPNHPGDVGSAPRTAGGPTPIRLPSSVSATLLSFKSPATTTPIGRTGAPSDSPSHVHPPPLSHDGFYPYVRNVQSPLGTLARIGMVLLHPGGAQGTGGTRSPEQGPRELRSHCPLLRFTGNPPPPRHDLGC